MQKILGGTAFSGQRRLVGVSWVLEALGSNFAVTIGSVVALTRGLILADSSLPVFPTECQPQIKVVAFELVHLFLQLSRLNRLERAKSDNLLVLAKVPLALLCSFVQGS